jgi:hypothetical protein
LSASCAQTGEAAIAAAIATADTSALPPARNTAFAINVKILALFLVPVLPAPTPHLAAQLDTKPAQTRHLLCRSEAE